VIKLFEKDKNGNFTLSGTPTGGSALKFVLDGDIDQVWIDVMTIYVERISVYDMAINTSFSRQFRELASKIKEVWIDGECSASLSKITTLYDFSIMFKNLLDYRLHPLEYEEKVMKARKQAEQIKKEIEATKGESDE